MTGSRKLGRIYPVDVKQPSNIDNWGKWPEDVEATIRDWNRGKGLSFAWIGTFKCEDCQKFCKAHRYGAAQLNGVPLCDDCLIARARQAA